MLSNEADPSAMQRRALGVSPSGLAAAFRVAALVLAAILLCIVLTVKVTEWWMVDFDAAFWFEAGVLFAILTLTRPWWFWNHPKAMWLRDIIGDKATIVLYLIVAGGIMVVSVRRQVAIAHTRADCARALAGVSDVHARLRILYHAGAVAIPRLESSEPRALNCERLLEQR